MRLRSLSIVSVGIVGFGLLGSAGCGPAGTPGAPGGGGERAPAAPVRIAKVSRADLPYEIQAIGTVEAYSSVDVKSRVDGQIVRVHVADGEEIRAGQLLFELDPVPFLEAVRLAEANVARDLAAEKQAQANVARDAAQARTARAQAERYKALEAQGIVAREITDQMQAAAEAAEASLAANQAAVESARAALRADEARLAQARLDLSYTKIHAPISGRAGFVQVKEGNLVKENDTVALVSILRVRPVFVTFAVPEQALVEIRAHGDMRALPVEVEPAGQPHPPVAGRLDSFDNAIDSTTGTIKLKAVFPNADLRLWPGQFVNTRLRLRVDEQAVVAPSQAVQNGPHGTFAWVVRADGTVEPRTIDVAREHGEQSLIAAGLTEGDTVVTEGHLRLREGAAVEVLTGSPTADASPGRMEPQP